MKLSFRSNDLRQQRAASLKLRRTFKAGVHYTKNVRIPISVPPYEGVYLWFRNHVPIIVLMKQSYIVCVAQEGLYSEAELGFKFKPEDVKSLSTSTAPHYLGLSYNSNDNTDRIFQYLTRHWASMAECKLNPASDNYFPNVENLYQVIRTIRTIYPGKYVREALALDFGTSSDTVNGQCFKVTTQPSICGMVGMSHDKSYKVLKALETGGQL